MIRKVIFKFFLVLNFPFNFLPREVYLTIKNKRFWKLKSYLTPLNPKKVIITEVHLNNFITVGTTLFSNILARVKGAKIINLVHFKGDENNLKLFKKSFSNCVDFVIDDEISQEEIEIKTTELLQNINSPDELYNFKYKGCLLGDCIYDTILRDSPTTPKATIKHIDEDCIEIIKYFAKSLLAFEKIESKYEVVGVNYSHMTGIGGFTLRYFSFKGITTYTGIIGRGALSKNLSFDNTRIRNSYMANGNLIKNVFKNDELKNKLIKKADKYLDDRFNMKLKDRDSFITYSKEKRLFTSSEEFCEVYNLDKNKPLVFVLLHAFTDFPNVAMGIHKDYYEFFNDTFLEAVKNTSVNWIFKEHPAAHRYVSDTNVSNIFDFVDHKHILFMPANEKFNALSIQKICHAVVTSHGSVAIELACMGKTAIINGLNHFTEFEICHNAFSIKEYHAMLSNIANLKPPNSHAIERAKVALFISYGIHINSPTNNKIALPPPENFIRDIENFEEIFEFFVDTLYSPKFEKYYPGVVEFIKNDNLRQYYEDQELVDCELFN